MKIARLSTMFFGGLLYEDRVGRVGGRRRRGFKGDFVHAVQLEALECRQLLSTYYVATGGNDGSDGSAGSPFKSLQKAADMVVAGDTVIVRAGTYGAGFVLGW